jgi:hypothetical protein
MRRLFMVVVLIALMAGCENGPKAAQRVGDGQSKEIQSEFTEHFSETKEGLRFEVKVNVKYFNDDEEIYIAAKVTNVSGSPIRYVAGSSGGAHCQAEYPHVKILFDDHKGFEEMGDVPANLPDCPADEIMGDMAPNTSFTRNVAFDPKVKIGNERVQPTRPST